jgi:voltage-gated potassium channel
MSGMPPCDAPGAPGGLRDRLRQLYHGRSPAALRFQMATAIIDIVIIAFFIVTPLIRDRPAFLWIDYSVAAILALEIGARMLAASNVFRLLRQPTMLLDLVILATLLVPESLENFGFLRILRLWTLSRRSSLWVQFRRTGLREWEDAARAVINLTTFLFVVTGFIYTFFFAGRPGIEGYVDAFYFTVTTMTTTGFGDITLPGVAGKLTSIVVMIVGISLFVRLAQAVFRPNKVTFPCPRCGLQRHEPDAVHCKACGIMLCIPDPD